MTETEPLMRNSWEEEETCVSRVKSRIGFILSVTFTILVIIAVIIAVVIGWLQTPPVDMSLLLSEAVTADECTNIYNHLESLQYAYNGSRSVLTGYNASAEYIISTLENAGVGCKIDKQYFPTPIYTELESPILTMVYPLEIEFQLIVDFAGLRYGGNGYYNLPNRTVCVIPEGGCKSEDFANVTTGCIALILDQKDCHIFDKSIAAQYAGAGAVILYNDINRNSLLSTRVRHSGWFMNDTLMEIPVLAGSYSLGKLLTSVESRLNLITNTTIEIVETFNVFCITEAGDPKNLIVAGAHLDSVPEGPGMNDNGSGSTTLLEIVLQWFSLGLKPVNQIQFVWWGSEEVGLIGSWYFVKDMMLNNPEQFKNITMALNFDMLASPNYYLGIHNGATAVTAKNQSSVITSMFVEYFDLMEIPYSLISLTSGSDFVPFIENGIPSGGLAAGASSIKSEEGRTVFGGFANAPHDPCYHRYCDTVDNINYEALGYLAGAAAYVIQKAAQEPNLREVLDTPPEYLNIHQFMGSSRAIFKEEEY